MRKILSLLPLLLASLLLTALPLEAQAKRLGYGGSMGKQYSMPQKAPTPPAAAPMGAQGSTKAAPAGKPSGASRWLGPLAGLMAGGLLASLFFGDAFEGFQFMDFLLMAGLAFGAFMLFRALRGGRPAPAQPQPAAAGATYREAPAFDTSEFLRDRPSAGGDAGFDSATFAPEAPVWFDGTRFAEGAKLHFIRLQAAWDKGDMRDIAEYTTPELYASLQAERLSRGDQTHFTEVVQLHSELAGVQRDGGQVVASVRFTGLIREEQGAEAQPFAELWHVVHDWASAEGDWRVAGIQQEG